MKLNLGCAKDIKEGYINVDLNYKHPDVINEDISNLSFVKDGTVEEIYAKDILEHLPIKVAINCLKKWYAYLQPGGTIYIQTTNFNRFVEAYSKRVWDIYALNYMLFSGVNWIGAESQSCDFHKSVYSIEFLENELKKIGYSIISKNEDTVDYPLMQNAYAHNLNLTIIAKK